MFVIQFQQMIVQLFEEDKNEVFSLQKIFEHNILANYLNKKRNLIFKDKKKRHITCFTKSLKSTLI